MVDIQKKIRKRSYATIGFEPLPFQSNKLNIYDFLFELAVLPTALTRLVR